MQRPPLTLLILLAAPILAAEPPVGAPYRVNTYATGAQRASSAALGRLCPVLFRLSR